ncbi:MAG TPA: HNH endonuclease signature motif containing protein, partial [Bdellovibrionota bacterium]|nr:HNH endonuclease signature motif containing protein [Bdellovibrionota bacterium]
EETLLAKIEKLKALLSHRNPNPSYAELIEMLADMALKRLDPEQKADATPEQKGKPKPEENPAEKRAATPPAEKSKAKQTRHIPQKLRSAVWKRDKGQCTFINRETGVRCGSSHLLEIHHLKDFSLGGKHTLDNPTLRCQCHNVHAAIRTYGGSLMYRYLRDRARASGA